METPPGTTLSTPSPTELYDKDPVVAEAEKQEMLSSLGQKWKPIYLIVATTPCTVKSSSGTVTRKLGIGHNGKLPWPIIRADMNYFRRVTRDSSRSSSTRNSVIMGRKTYDSIPSKFRPLDKRLNVIITRTKPVDAAKGIITDLDTGANKMQKSDEGTSHDSKFETVEDTKFDGVLIKKTNSNDFSGVLIGSSLRSAVESQAKEDDYLYCIGGAEIYSAFLRDDTLRPRLRILQTEIQKLNEGEEFECDTFWPEVLEDSHNGWKEVNKDEVVRWTSIEVPQGPLTEWLVDDKVGVKLRVRGWEQQDI